MGKNVIGNNVAGAPLFRSRITIHASVSRITFHASRFTLHDSRFTFHSPILTGGNAMYFLSVWLHILAAAVWVGGLIYTAAVAGPFALTHEVAERHRVLRGFAPRLRSVSWSPVVRPVLTWVRKLKLRPESNN